MVRGQGLVTRAGQVRTRHDGDHQAGADPPGAQRAAHLQLAGQRPASAPALHGQSRGEPAYHTGLRDAEKAGRVGNRGIYLPVGMFLPRHRSRAVAPWYT